MMRWRGLVFVCLVLIPRTVAGQTGPPVSILQGGNVAIVDATGALKVTGGGGGGGTVDQGAAGVDPWLVTGTIGATQSGVWTVAISGSHDVTNAGTFATQATLQTGSNQIGHLESNQSVNVAQINGVTPLMGAGNTGTGSPRVTIATDQANFTTPLNVADATANKVIWGSAQTVISTAVDVAASNFSATTTTFDNTTDSAVPYATRALAVGSFPDWAAAPVAGTTVDLYCLFLNVDGTSDETDAPSGTAAGGAHYMGSWIIAAADALQRRAITIDISNVLQMDCYFRNGTAQNMNNDGGTSAIVKITPFVGRRTP